MPRGFRTATNKDDNNFSYTVIDLTSFPMIENLVIVRTGKIRFLKMSLKGNLVSGSNNLGKPIPAGDTPAIGIDADVNSLDGDAYRVSIGVDGTILVYRPAGSPASPNMWIYIPYTTT